MLTKKDKLCSYFFFELAKKINKIFFARTYGRFFIKLIQTVAFIFINNLLILDVLWYNYTKRMNKPLIG